MLISDICSFETIKSRIFSLFAIKVVWFIFSPFSVKYPNSSLGLSISKKYLFVFTVNKFDNFSYSVSSLFSFKLFDILNF